jgi:putative membrane protein insertion efficiency factor
VTLRAALLKAAFTAYKRVLSPVLHSVGVSRCIFLPTCSEYAYVAMLRHGVVRGSMLAAKRIARCHPLSKGGLDPVP